MYKLGFALSGGGAKGFAHLGALQALNERGIYPDIISGTSAGALAGVFYADGYTPKEILSLFRDKSFNQFAQFTLPQSGLFKNNGLRSFLKKHLKAQTFEELSLPVHIVATDIEHGLIQVFKTGSLIAPIVASCSIPIVFQPTEVDGRYYVDGGIFKNFPVSPIRKLCDKIIGVNVTPLTQSSYKNSLKYVMERTFHYMWLSNTLVDRKHCDYLIEATAASDYSMFDLEHLDDIYNLGYDLTVAFIEKHEGELRKNLGDTFH